MSTYARSDHPDVLQREFDSPYAALDAMRAEVTRLRVRTHEIQDAENQRRAKLESDVAHHRECARLAEAAVAEFGADWCKGPPGTLWTHSSWNTKRALIGLVEQIEALRRQVHESHIVVEPDCDFCATPQEFPDNG